MDNDIRQELQALRREIAELRASARISATRQQVATAAEVIFLKITGDADGSEKYKGKRLAASSNRISSSGDLVEEELGVLSGSEAILFLNAERLGDSNADITHILTDGGQTPYAMGIFAGRSDDEPSLIVVKGFSLASVECDTEGGGT